MKRILGILLLSMIMLAVFSSLASAEQEMLVFIAGSTSDRVHLREQPSSNAQSMGLYFTGTPAMCLWGGDEQWTEVVIGSEKGYVYSDLLKKASETDPADKEWKIAFVKVSGTVNMRQAPDLQAEIIARWPDGQKVAVLGETADRWCYVRADGQYGYIMSRYLDVQEERFEQPSAVQADLPLPFPVSCYYTSGVGAWANEMTILPDGSFWGYYHNMDMGDFAASYPHGTMYECSYTGRFDRIHQRSASEYQMEVSYLQTFGIKDDPEIRNQIRWIVFDSYGIRSGETFSLYLQDLPAEQMPQEAARQFALYAEGRKYGLYGHQSEAAWWVE